MLNEREKKEMLADARSPKRRENFRQARQNVSTPPLVSLDDYLKFLSRVTKVFSSIKPRS